MFLHFLHVPAFDDTLVDDSLVDEKGGLDETTEDWEVADDGLNLKEVILFLHLNNSFYMINLFIPFSFSE